jgi:hypothetical protein
MKIIAFYLPQFHEVEENNKWWGEGFTEWTNVKKAKQIIKCQNQPRIPYNDNYYDLTNPKSIEWQANLAKKYGIYGFCIYHYWFEGDMLLEKPAEILLENKDIDINFCFSWANTDWTDAWKSEKTKVLKKQTYGDKDVWFKHFNYMLPFFKDKRYIKEENKPLFVIYKPDDFDKINNFIDYWNILAIKEGFSGIKFIYQHVSAYLDKKFDDSKFSHNIEYQPQYVMSHMYQMKFTFIKKIKRKMVKIIYKLTNYRVKFDAFRGLIKEDYEIVWKKILSMNPSTDKAIPGAFVDWDNTPRRGMRGSICCGMNVDLFESNLTKQILRARTLYKTDKIFLFAWNEWAESGYLEPDKKDEFKRLESIKNALNKAN